MTANPELFSEFQTPEGIERETVVDNLLMETAELEVLFADPNFMQKAIGSWSRKELPVWSRMWAAMQLEYNPIENYDRIEDWEDSNEVNRTNRAETNSRTGSSGQSTSTASETGSQQDEKGVAAYNSSDFSPTENVVRDDTRKRDGITSDSTTTSGNVENTGSENEEAKSKKSGRAHGNIGVTTTQSMLRQELQIAEFNVIDFIIQSFKRRFCLLVY